MIFVSVLFILLLNCTLSAGDFDFESNDFRAMKLNNLDWDILSNMSDEQRRLANSQAIRGQTVRRRRPSREGILREPTSGSRRKLARLCKVFEKHTKICF